MRMCVCVCWYAYVYVYMYMYMYYVYVYVYAYVYLYVYLYVTYLCTCLLLSVTTGISCTLATYMKNIDSDTTVTTAKRKKMASDYPIKSEVATWSLKHDWIFRRNVICIF